MAGAHNTIIRHRKGGKKEPASDPHSHERRGKQMETNNNNQGMEEVIDNLQDAVSLIILLENDMSEQCADDIYLRTIRLIHKCIRTARNRLSEEMKGDSPSVLQTIKKPL